LQVRERLLILPIIGVIDSQRARQLTSSWFARHPRQPPPSRGRGHHGRARH